MTDKQTANATKLNEYKYLDAYINALHRVIKGSRKQETELIHKAKQEIRRIRTKQKNISKSIDNLNDTELRQILRDKYINGYSLQIISENIGYSEKTVIRKHLKALDSL